MVWHWRRVVYFTCFHCWTTSNKYTLIVNILEHCIFFFKVWTSQISLFSGNQMIFSTIMGTECVPFQLSHPMGSKWYLIQLKFFFCTQITNSNSDIATTVLTMIFIFSFKYIIYNLINRNCLLSNSLTKSLISYHLYCLPNTKDTAWTENTQV